MVRTLLGLVICLGVQSGVTLNTRNPRDSLDLAILPDTKLSRGETTGDTPPAVRAPSSTQHPKQLENKPPLRVRDATKFVNTSWW